MRQTYKQWQMARQRQTQTQTDRNRRIDTDKESDMQTGTKRLQHRMNRVIDSHTDRQTFAQTKTKEEEPLSWSGVHERGRAWKWVG